MGTSRCRGESGERRAERIFFFPLRSPLSALFLALLLTACAKRPTHPNILLITLDTFRADRIGANTPNLQKLAGASVRFTNADSPVPLTLPAHCSILSGVLPLHHGVRNNGGNPFPPDRETLATLFAAAGYRTGAFVSSFVLDHRFGLQRGFDRYDDEIPRDATAEANTLEAERRGDVTVDRALAWLHETGSRPYFAWVHLYDAHAPYAPPPPYPQTYDGEIAFVDAQVGRLLAAIDRKNTIVLIVGDHGESLGEHGELTHGLLVYEATLHVPMLLAAPDAEGHEVRTPVSSIDIAPTLAQLAGLKLNRADGIALPLKGEPDAKDLYAESQYPTTFGWSALSAIRRGASKLISNRELYDLGRDPNEKTNVLANDRRTFRALDTAMLEIGKSEAAASTQTTVDEETRRKLASLGYVAPSGAPSTGNHPDPVAMTPLFRQFEEATWALNGGRPKEAIAAFTKLVAADSRNPVFRESLGRALRQTGDNEAAVRLYRESVAIAPNNADAWYNLAVALQDAGHRDEAGIAIREAIRRDDKRPETHNALGVALMSEGNAAGAEDEFRRAIALDQRNARAWNNLGNILRATNRLDDARAAYTQSSNLAPSYADPLNGAGVIDVQQDHPRDAILKFDAALRIAPNYYEAELNRGIALKMAGDDTGAADQLKRLLATLPAGPAWDQQRTAARSLLH
ncbi:MAG TPA: sulfatase-like hydrolase/transferase [Thermoanaerobaculia bacterium]|jgi:arylsulfatase A-like enzyme/Flp pilus assembly protein TadD